jgi:hypothetical protein
MEFFKSIFTTDFWFKIDPSAIYRADQFFLVLGVALVILGIAFRLGGRFSSHQFSKRVWQRLSNLMLTIGLLEIFWYGLRFQNIRLFGTRAVALLMLIMGIIWLVPILRYRFKQYHADVSNWSKEQLKQKYLRQRS